MTIKNIVKPKQCRSTTPSFSSNPREREDGYDGDNRRGDVIVGEVRGRDNAHERTEEERCSDVSTNVSLDRSR